MAGTWINAWCACPACACAQHARVHVHVRMRVHAQGNFVEEVAEFLIKTYAIPRKYFQIKKA